jgi:hypothetical protein
MPSAAGGLALLAVCACGPTAPSRSIAGSWFARGIGHSQVFELVLQQDGERVSGSACGVDGGIVLFSGAPVRSTHPNVQFIVTAAAAGACCPHLAGRQFSGRLDDTGDVVGQFGTIDLRFTRSEGGLCR